MTLEEHKTIGAWLNDKGKYLITTNALNAVGKSSRIGKSILGFNQRLTLLKSDLEGLAYKDGFSEVATDIYYSDAPDETLCALAELLKQVDKRCGGKAEGDSALVAACDTARTLLANRSITPENGE